MGMRTVHSCGKISSLTEIVHRDLKTPNVFLKIDLVKNVPVNPFEEKSIAAVADFGLARLMQGGSMRVVKEDGSTMDRINPTWAAPEILAGGKDYTTKSDVYAMASCCWRSTLASLRFLAVLRGFSTF